jgi:xylulokinase
MALAVGIDSSTTATKVEIVDVETGKRWGRGREPHPPTGTPPRSEQDPSAWWAALIQAFHRAGRYEDVAAISVAGQQHGMVALDADHHVLRPAKLWNDTESAGDAEQLVRTLGARAWADAVGSVPTASYTITKLAWLRQREPDRFAALATVALPHDWLTFRLTGRLVTDRGDASGTGYWSPPEGRWRRDLLGLLDADRDWDTGALPLVLSPFEPAGALQAAAAAPLNLTGLDVVVGPGTGDNMAAALGIGLEPGDVAVSIGTSGTVFAVSDRPTADATGAVAGFADATGRFLPLVCTLNATKVTDAVARLLGVDSLDDLALACPPGAGGLVLLPYLDGERTPNRPDATGTIAGLRSDVTREQLARAAVEGVVCGLLDGLDALTAAGVDTSGRVHLIGGGARSRAYRHVLADLLQRPVTVPDPDAEHVAVGAAVQAACVLTKAGPAEIAQQWRLGRGDTVDPDPTVDPAAVRAAYAEVRDRP